MNQDVERKIQNFVTTALQAGNKSVDIRRDQPLLSTGLLDSLFVVDFVLFIETEFKLDFSNETISAQDIGTLSEMIQLVESRLSN